MVGLVDLWGWCRVEWLCWLPECFGWNAKQANDFTLESDAAKARVRAERRCGQLLKETDFNKGGRKDEESTGTTTEPVKTLNEMGINKKQSSKWQKLADIPDEEFEEKVKLAVPLWYRQKNPKLYEHRFHTRTGASNRS